MIKKKFPFSIQGTLVLLLTIALSFFLYIMINVFCSFLTVFILDGKLLHKPYIYAQVVPCRATYNNGLNTKMMVFLLIFTVLKFYVFHSISWLKKQKYLIIQTCIYTVIITDILYIGLDLAVPKGIDWSVYFYSSAFIRSGVVSEKYGLIFLLIGFLLNFKALNIKFNVQSLLNYFLLAFCSFFFQLGITYIVFGKIIYRI